jgi:hypothetical protein
MDGWKKEWNGFSWNGMEGMEGCEGMEGPESVIR